MTYLTSNLGETSWSQLGQELEFSIAALLFLSAHFSNEIHVNGNTPPAFIVHAHDDGVAPLNSVRYYAALRANNVPAELHIFSKKAATVWHPLCQGPVAHWTMLAEEWLKS